jgi:hypothetical protein
MALIVNQTPAVHKQIAHMLEALRKLQDVEVALEIRIINVPESFLEQAQPDTGFKSALGLTFLDEQQVCQLLEAVQGDQRANIMQAPKLTVANGQPATVSVTDNRFYVTNVEMVRCGGQVCFVPKNEAVATGFQMSVQPAVSSDRRYVQLDLKVKQSELASEQVPLYPVAFTVKPRGEGGEGKPLLFTQYIQQPAVTSGTVEKSLTIPDGKSALLEGWKKVRETRTEYGPPVLSKVPYLDRLFKNVGYGREMESVVLLVTPHIIVNERQEAIETADHKTEKAKAKKVAKLLKKYERACKEGKLGEAKNLARTALELAPSCFSAASHHSGECQQAGCQLNEPEECDSPALPPRALLEQAEEYERQAQKVAENVRRLAKPGSENADRCREQYRSSLAKAKAAYGELIQELEKRLAVRKLTGEEDQLLRKASFASAECRFLQGEYAAAVGCYEALAIRYAQRPDGLHALAGLAKCHWAQERGAEAQTAVERVRDMLKKMSDSDFQNSRWSRQQWEEWLLTVSKRSGE